MNTFLPLPPNRVSQHFTKAEATKSDWAQRNGVSNQPTSDRIWARLRYVFGNVMEPIRELHGGPIRVNSAYRTPRVNRAVGGSETSDHMRGFSVDFEPVNGDAEALFYQIQRAGMLQSLPIDQLIYYPIKGHIHVGVRTRNPRRNAGLSRPGKRVQWLA